MEPPRFRGHLTWRDHAPGGGSDEEEETAVYAGVQGRRGDCRDNALAESFFSTPKSDLALDGADLTPDLAHAQVTDYIVHFDNPPRRHSTLDYFSPIEYVLKHIVHQQST